MRRRTRAQRTLGVTSGLTALLLLAACTVEPPPESPPDASPSEPVPADSEAATDPDVRHVAPDGDDGDPGTEDRPWATIAHAVTQLRPGQTLVIADGEYRERVTDVPLRPGTTDAPITVVAADGARPVLRGLLWLRDLDHWRIDGLNVTWDEERGADDEHMVKLLGGEGWSFTGAEVWGARSYAAILVAEDPSDWRLADLCVHDTAPTNDVNQDQLLYLNTGLDAGPGTVEGNVLFGAANGAGIKLGGPSDDSGGAVNVWVVANTIVDTQQGILVSWRSADNVIERNLIYGAGPNYGLIRSFGLEAGSNVARDNVGGGAGQFFLDYRSPDAQVADGGGNRFPVEPNFDDNGSCDGFRPRHPVAASAGHTAATG